MINIDNYPKEETAVLTRISRGYASAIRFVFDTNACKQDGEPCEFFVWDRAYERGKPLPEELKGKVPPDTDIRHVFILSFRSQETIEKIIDDVLGDEHFQMFEELEQATGDLRHRRFYPDIDIDGED